MVHDVVQVVGRESTDEAYPPFVPSARGAEARRIQVRRLEGQALAFDLWPVHRPQRLGAARPPLPKSLTGRHVRDADAGVNSSARREAGVSSEILSGVKSRLT